MESLETSPTNEQLQAVKDVLASFLLSLKNFGLYPENHDICQKCLRNVFKRLEGFLDSVERLRLDIEKDRIIYQNEIVFQDSAGAEDLAFFLFRDGIKWIEFKKSITNAEIRSFLKILNKYRTTQEDPEGDLVTALWEANFPNIHYGASDIYWDSEPLLDLQVLSLGETKSLLTDASEEEHETPLSQAYQDPENGLYKLTAEETARLREMILEEEKRDSVQDLLDMVSILMKDQGNKDYLDTLLQFVKNEIKAALAKGKFKLAYKTLRAVHTIRLTAKTEEPWAVTHFNHFIKAISHPQNLNILSSILPTLDQADKDRVKLIRQFLLLLPSDALQALTPMLSQIRSLSVEKQFIEILEIMASRDLRSLERLLTSQDEYMVQRLVYIAGRIPGRKAFQILLNMIDCPLERVRKQAVKSLLVRDPLSLETIFPLIEDSSKDVRQLIFDHLKRHPNKMGEKLLLQYLQKKRFALKNKHHILTCYKTLGKCGSVQSISFLKSLIFKRRWLPDFHGSIHRQGAVTALMELGSKEAKTILSKASRSLFPTVRIAYKRGLEAIQC